MDKNGWLLGLLLVWDLVWRGMALWRSAKEDQKIWFVALLIVNSVGILPIAYLVFVAKEKFWVKKNAPEPIQEAVVVKKKKRG